jgi:hypothetical protein
MYSKSNRHWILAALIIASFSGIGLSQQLKIEAGRVMRPGLSSVLSLKVVRNSISGPVRCVVDLPKDWRLEKYYLNDFVRIDQKDHKATLTWLEFPMMDTLYYDVQVCVPQDQPQNSVQLGATLYYFDAMGKLVAIRSNDINVRVMKYFSRF